MKDRSIKLVSCFTKSVISSFALENLYEKLKWVILITVQHQYTKPLQLSIHRVILSTTKGAFFILLYLWFY